MSERLTIKLTQPIQIGSERVEELSFREPKARDLIDIDLVIGEKGMRIEMNSVLLLATRCSGQKREVIHELCLRDMTEVGKIVVDFIVSSQAIGESGLDS